MCTHDRFEDSIASYPKWHIPDSGCVTRFASQMAWTGKIPVSLMTAIGTQPARAYATACPQLAEADVRAPKRSSCFDPQRTSTAVLNKDPRSRLAGPFDDSVGLAEPP